MEFTHNFPPSMTIVCPVMNRPDAAARNTAAPAMSSGSPIRRSGVSASRVPNTAGFSHNTRAKSVRTRPGAMQFARIPRGPHSTARFRTNCMSAALDTPYAPSVAVPRNPAIDDTMITDPYTPRRHSGQNHRAQPVVAAYVAPHDAIPRNRLKYRRSAHNMD